MGYPKHSFIKLSGIAVDHQYLDGIQKGCYQNDEPPFLRVMCMGKGDQIMTGRSAWLITAFTL
jgi:hypothetical protein